MMEQEKDYNLQSLEVFVQDAAGGKFGKVDTTASPYIRLSFGKEYTCTENGEYYYSFDGSPS